MRGTSNAAGMCRQSGSREASVDIADARWIFGPRGGAWPTGTRNGGADASFPYYWCSGGPVSPPLLTWSGRGVVLSVEDVKTQKDGRWAAVTRSRCTRGGASAGAAEAGPVPSPWEHVSVFAGCREGGRCGRTGLGALPQPSTARRQGQHLVAGEPSSGHANEAHRTGGKNKWSPPPSAGRSSQSPEAYRAGPSFPRAAANGMPERNTAPRTPQLLHEPTM